MVVKKLDLIKSLLQDLDDDEYELLHWKLLDLASDIRDDHDSCATVINQLCILLESIKE